MTPASGRWSSRGFLPLCLIGALVGGIALVSIRETGLGAGDVLTGAVLAVLLLALVVSLVGARAARMLRRPGHVAATGVLSRGLDITLALALLLLTLPLLLVTALAIKLDGPGPVLHRQRRIGPGGRPFNLIRFRTLETAEKPGCGASPMRRDEPPLTRKGRWIRLARLDGIPELINVLRGDLALLGPRTGRTLLWREGAR